MCPKRPKLVKASIIPTNMNGQEGSTSYTPLIVPLQAYLASTKTLSRFLVLCQLSCEILYHLKISLPHLNSFAETAQS